MRFAVAPIVGLVFWAVPAAADLYRWVDPETGTVKFSSYPPPWHGDADKARGQPKVEVIPPTRKPPAFEPRQDADPGGGDAADANAPRSDPRDHYMKQLSRRIASFISSPPDAAPKAYAALLEPLQELEILDQKLKSSKPGEEAVRLEEKWRLAVPLESHRADLIRRISNARPPPAGAAPGMLERAWRATQLQLSALEWTNEAMKRIDPRKENLRHFEVRALAEKTLETWEPYIDPASGPGTARGDRGR